MFSLTGLGAAATIVNLVVLSSAASSANSDIYSTSRMLRSGPPGAGTGIFARLSRSITCPSTPLFLSCVCLLTIVIMATGGSISTAFTPVTPVSARPLHGRVWVVVDRHLLVYHRKPSSPAQGIALQVPRRCRWRGWSWRSWGPWASFWRCGDDTRPGLVYYCCGLNPSWARRTVISCCVVRRAASWATVVRGEVPTQGPLHEWRDKY